jgi:hypothetical protein
MAIRIHSTQYVSSHGNPTYLVFEYPYGSGLEWLQTLIDMELV